MRKAETFDARNNEDGWNSKRVTQIIQNEVVSGDTASVATVNDTIEPLEAQLREVLIQLKILNFHLSIMTGIDTDDLGLHGAKLTGNVITRLDIDA